MIDDKVNAIDYSSLDSKCDIPEFRNYTTYRPLLVSFGPPVGGCALNGTSLPPDQTVQPPCQGVIDVQMASMFSHEADESI